MEHNLWGKGTKLETLTTNIFGALNLLEKHFPYAANGNHNNLISTLPSACMEETTTAPKFGTTSIVRLRVLKSC